jgi:hypothetical protein
LLKSNLIIVIPTILPANVATVHVLQISCHIYTTNSKSGVQNEQPAVFVQHDDDRVKQFTTAGSRRRSWHGVGETAKGLHRLAILIRQIASTSD